jgi:hypothetical protein
MESVSFRDVFCDVSFRASSIVKILQIITIYLRVEVGDKLLDWAQHRIQDRKHQLVCGNDL